MIDILSCTVIITFFRLFKYFRLEPRMGVLLDSVTQASRDIFWFLIAWLCTTGGFAGCAFLLFGHSNLDFHRMDSAMFMLVRMMLGELDAISELVDSQFYVANIYFILFAI